MLLDTHALLWWFAGDERRLSARARRELARASALLVSPVSCWEVATLVDKGRVRLDRSPHQWTRDVLAHERVEEAPLSAHAATTAGLLGSTGFHGDLADRLLYATARALAVPLLTKDPLITAYCRAHREVKAVW